MKKIFTLSLLLVMTLLPVMAQPGRYMPRRPSAYGYAHSRPHYDSRVSPYDIYYGLRVGMGLSTVNSDDPYLDGGSVRTGLNLGLIVGFQLVPATPFYLETGLLYAEKGGKGNYRGDFSYSMNYLEVPFVLKYQHNFDRLTSIQPFFGVYGGVGVGGKIKDFGERVAYSSFSDDAFRRCDGGLRMGCGLQFDHLYAEVGYDLGLANVTRDYFDDAHTGSLFVNVGLNF